MDRAGRRRGLYVFLLFGLLLVHACGDDGGGGPGPGDLTPPTITRGPWVEGTTASSTEIHWRTNEAGNSRVSWTDDLGGTWDTTTVSTLVSDHLVTVYPLNAETRYYFRAHSADQAGNTVTSSADSFETFSTLPTLVIDPMRITIAAGDSVALAIRALNVTDLFGVAFYVGVFGTSVVMEGDTLDAGSFLGDDPQVLWQYDEGEERLEVAITRRYPDDGVDGNGTLAWIHLEALVPGTTMVDFRDGSIVLRDSSGVDIPDFDQLRVEESWVTVQ